MGEVFPRPFGLKLYPHVLFDDEFDQRVPPHRLVIEPLLAVSTEVVVHHAPGRRFEVPVPQHSVRRSVVSLDTTKEVLRGWESFWNAPAWKRGAISIRVPFTSVDWPAILAWCEYAGRPASRYQILKGTPRAAVTYADREAVGEWVVATLTASNGIQHLLLWTEPDRCLALDALAQEACSHFVRWVEQGKFPREIVYDREPYRSML